MPWLLSVTDFGSAVDPHATAPKSTLVGVSDALTAPLPERAIAEGSGAQRTVSATLMVAEPE